VQLILDAGETKETIVLRARDLEHSTVVPGLGSFRPSAGRSGERVEAEELDRSPASPAPFASPVFGSIP